MTLIPCVRCCCTAPATCRYQLNIDGTVAAYRMPALLAGNSVVLKQESDYYEHFYKALKPYRHYIPVNRCGAAAAAVARSVCPPDALWVVSVFGAGQACSRNGGDSASTYTGIAYLAASCWGRDLSNLTAAAAWARDHDAEAMKISRRGRLHARQHLRIEDVYCYHANAFARFAALQKMQPKVSCLPFPLLYVGIWYCALVVVRVELREELLPCGQCPRRSDYPGCTRRG